MSRSIGVRMLSVAIFLVLLASTACAAGPESATSNWSRSLEFKDKFGGEIKITATYYAGEYIEAQMMQEAERNLWTADELENYKYELLKSLQLDDYIPIMLEFDNRGPALHMSPFDSMATLWIGNKKYSPADYDRRFNFKIEEKREGLVFFPKYDEKTGKPLLEKAGSIRLILNDAVSPLTLGKRIEYIWDVSKDSGQFLLEGAAAEKLEVDRLIKRLQKLNKEKMELESELEEKHQEISIIEQRLEELR
ncbi:MAG: hypothetical protein KBG03_03805 [Synergistales bacterium]|nr:hypothetical protein [Synergistales bacterium]HOC82418.1 hypothetical protein [Synergistales bacterium]HQL01790.1 hypothetical protein [Synergistales bacterium]